MMDTQDHKQHTLKAQGETGQVIWCDAESFGIQSVVDYLT